jgi:hypothetical protein
MGLSETIVAAIIGALATMGTAIFQLIRNRAPSESRPKKNRMRSIVATIALMIGCIVGGYAWSALRAVSAREELRATMNAAMEEQLNKRFGALAAQQQGAPVAATGASALAPDGSVIPAASGAPGSAESIAHLPPCHVPQQAADAGPVACTESSATTVGLCAIVPAGASTHGIRIQTRVPKSDQGWEDRSTGAGAPGSLRVAAEPTEYPATADKRSVCLDVSNWSVNETLAVRVIVDYDFAPAPSPEITAAAPGGTTL